MRSRFDPPRGPSGDPAETDERSRFRAMPAPVRRRLLQTAVNERGFVSVAEVAREIGISEMTVRRDLDALQRIGAIERSHGGAVAARQGSSAMTVDEPSFASRAHLNAAAKLAIARAAAGLISQREVIGLDVGSTIACLAGVLGGRAGLAVVTNSLQAVAALSAACRPMPDVYLLGGELRAAEGSLCGAIALRQLADHWLNKVFVGAAGLCEDGLFDYAVEETQVTKAYIRIAAEVILLCDSSKFGLRGFVQVCALDQVHRLVTDTEPPAPLRAALDRHGVQVTIAPSVMNEAA